MGSLGKSGNQAQFLRLIARITGVATGESFRGFQQTVDSIVHSYSHLHFVF